MLPLDRQNQYRERYKTIMPGWRTSGERYESFVRRALTSPGMRVLDVGCGAGGVMELVGKQVCLPVGIDVDLTSLLHHRDQTIRLAVADLTTLPFPDETFDLVLSSWVLEHLVEPGAAFAEIARVLRPGGHFVFMTPNARNVITMINRSVPRLLQSRLVRLFYNRSEQDTFPVVYKCNTLGTINSLAESAGLHALDIEHISDPTYLALDEWLFRLSVLIERLTPRENAVHLVGDYVKD